MGLVKQLLCCLLSICILASPVLAQQSGGAAQPAPAERTELSEMGRSLKTVMFSPTRGLQTNITDLGRSEQNAAVLNNLQQIKKGVWTSRGIGTRHLTNATTIVGATVEAYSFIGRKWNGTAVVSNQLVLWQVPGGVVVSTFIPGGNAFGAGAGAILNATSLNIDIAGSFCAFSDTQVVFTHPDTEPRIWDPTDTTPPSPALALSGSWPVTILGVQYSKPNFCENFASRVCFAGFADRPTTVVLSEYEDADSFTVSGTPLATDGGAITFPTSLGKITGLKRMRLDNTSNTSNVLLVGFDHGFGMITGTDAIDFTSVPLTEEFGLLSNRTWAQLGSEMFFLASDGIRKFSTGLGLTTLSNTTVSFPIKDLMLRINRTKAPLAFVVPHSTTQELMFWVPIDTETTNGHCIVMNYNTSDAAGGANISSPIWSTRDGAAYSCGTTIQQTFADLTDSNEHTLLGRYDLDNIYRAYSGDKWNTLTNGTGGTNYDWTYVSPLIGASTPAQNCSMRRLDILTDGPDQTFTVEAYALSQRADSNTGWYLQDTRSYSVTASSITNLQTWTTGTTTSYPKFIEFQPKGSGRYWAIRVKGTGGQHISLAGFMAALTLGGWKQ